MNATLTKPAGRRAYQAAMEHLPSSGVATLNGWKVVKDAHAHYWRAYRSAPVDICMSGASPEGLALAMDSLDAGLGAVSRG